MGSDLYLSIDVRHPNRSPNWFALFEGPSTDLARGIVVDAFGSLDDQKAGGDGYLNDEQMERPERPWQFDDTYWVRELPGAHFCDIIHEKRWQRLQQAPDGTYDFHDTECSPELRAFAALVKSLLDEGLDVRVWCWHSQ